MNKIKSIIHLASSVGSYGPTLSNIEKMNGLRSISLVYMNSKFNSNADISLFKSNKYVLIRSLFYLPWILIWIIFRYKNIHLNFGRNLIPFIEPNNHKYNKTKRRIVSFIEVIDLRILKFFKKKIFVVFQGSDIRMYYTLSKKYRYHIPVNNEYEQRIDNAKRIRLEKMLPYIDCIFYLNPDLFQFLPNYSIFIPYFHVVIPKTNGYKSESIVRIVHAPTNRLIKGTNKILQIIKELKSEGFNIKLILVENMSKQEALQVYKTADLFIDQLLIGWYGGVSVEVMSYGVPVMCYIRNEDIQMLNNEYINDIPIINATIDTLKIELINILGASSETLKELSDRVYRFVTKHHNQDKIASKIFGLYS